MQRSVLRRSSVCGPRVAAVWFTLLCAPLGPALRAQASDDPAVARLESILLRRPDHGAALERWCAHLPTAEGRQQRVDALAHEIAPNQQLAYQLLRGLVAEHDDRALDVHDAYRLARALDPDDGRADWFEGSWLTTRWEFEAASPFLDAALTKTLPTDLRSRALAHRADVAVTCGDIPSAQRIWSLRLENAVDDLSVWSDVARDQQDAGCLQEAYTTWTGLLERSDAPEARARARVAIAILCSRLGRPEEGLAVARRALADVDADAWQARDAWDAFEAAARQWGGAARVVTELTDQVRTLPHATTPARRLARALERGGDVEGALQILHDARQQHPTDVALWHDTIALTRRAGLVEQAVSLCDALLLWKPTDSVASDTRLDLMWSGTETLDDVLRAARWLDQRVEIEGPAAVAARAEALANKVDVSRRTPLTQRCVEWRRAAFERDPTSIAACVAYVEALILCGLEGEARTALGGVPRTESRRVAETCERLGFHDVAAVRWSHVLEDAPSLEAHGGLIRSLAASDASDAVLDEALADLDAASQTPLELEDALAIRLDVAQRPGRLAHELRRAIQSVTDAPNSSPARWRLGHLLQADGRDEAALATWNELIRRDDTPSHRLARATTLRNLGRLEPAVEDFERAAQHDALRARASEALARLHLARGAWDDAERWMVAWEAVPDARADARTFAVELAAARGDVDGELTALRRLVQARPENAWARERLAVRLAAQGHAAASRVQHWSLIERASEAGDARGAMEALLAAATDDASRDAIRERLRDRISVRREPRTWTRTLCSALLACRDLEGTTRIVDAWLRDHPDDDDFVAPLVSEAMERQSWRVARALHLRTRAAEHAVEGRLRLVLLHAACGDVDEARTLGHTLWDAADETTTRIALEALDTWGRDRLYHAAHALLAAWDDRFTMESPHAQRVFGASIDLGAYDRARSWWVDALGGCTTLEEVAAWAERGALAATDASAARLFDAAIARLPSEWADADFEALQRLVDADLIASPQPNDRADRLLEAVLQHAPLEALLRALEPFGTGTHTPASHLLDALLPRLVDADAWTRCMAHERGHRRLAAAYLAHHVGAELPAKEWRALDDIALTLSTTRSKRAWRAWIALRQDIPRLALYHLDPLVAFDASLERTRRALIERLTRGPPADRLAALESSLRRGRPALTEQDWLATPPCDALWREAQQQGRLPMVRGLIERSPHWDRKDALLCGLALMRGDVARAASHAESARATVPESWFARVIEGGDESTRRRWLDLELDWLFPYGPTENPAVTSGRAVSEVLALAASLDEDVSLVDAWHAHPWVDGAAMQALLQHTHDVTETRHPWRGPWHAGRAWLALGEVQKSLEAFDRADALAPSRSARAMIQLERARAWFELGRSDEATALLQEEVPGTPLSFRCDVAWTLATAPTPQLDAARKLIRDDAGRPEAWTVLAWIDAADGADDRRLDALLAKLDAHPSDSPRRRLVVALLRQARGHDGTWDPVLGCDDPGTRRLMDRLADDQAAP